MQFERLNLPSLELIEKIQTLRSKFTVKQKLREPQSVYKPSSTQ